MATLQFKRIKNTFPDFFVLKNSIGKEPYKLQPGEPLVATYKDGDATRTVLVVASADGDIEFIDYDGLEARVATAEEAVKDVTFKTQDTPSLHLGKDSSGSNTILSGDVKVSTASGNILSVNSTSLGNTQGLYAKVMLKRDGNGSLVLTTSSPLGEQTQTVPLDKEVHLSENGSFYNPVNKTLSLKMSNGSAVLVDLSNVVNVADIDNNILQDKALGLYAAVDLRYDSARNILYLTKTKAGGGTEEKSFQLNSMQLLDDITYDSLKEAIVIRFITQAGEFKKIEVPVSQLIREWRPYNEMHTVQIERTENKTGGQDLLSADVKIASDPDNILTKKNYQLYVKGVASNIRYSADPSSGATVRDKIDELQGDVSKVSSAVDTFNDAIEYVENIVSAVSGVSEAKINAIISGAGLNPNGSYRDKADDPDSYPYLGTAKSLDSADGFLARNLRSVSSQTSTNATKIAENDSAIRQNKADIDYVSGVVSTITGSASSAEVTELSGKVENIISAVSLNDNGSYKPIGHSGHPFIENAQTVQGAQISLDKAIQEVVSGTGLQVDSAHNIRYIAPSSISDLAAGATANSINETTSILGSSLVSLSGAVSGTPAAVTALQNKVDALSGVSQAEIDRIESGAGLNPDGTYIKDTDGTAFILSATSLANADNILDKAIKSISGKVDSLSGVNQAEIEEISGVASSTSGIVQNMLRDEALSGDGVYHRVQNTVDDPNPIIGQLSVSSFTTADKALQKKIIELSGKVTSDSGISGSVSALSATVVNKKADKFTPGQTDSITLHFDATDPNEKKLLGAINLNGNDRDCHFLDTSGTTVATKNIKNIIQVNGNGVSAYAHLDYNEATNTLYWSNGAETDSSGYTTGRAIQLSAGSIIKSMSASTGSSGELIIYYTTEGDSGTTKECKIPLSAFSTIALATDGEGVDIENTSGGSAVYTLRAKAKIDANPVNILRLTNDNHLIVSGLASNIRFYDNPSLSANTVQSVVSGLSGDVATISADVLSHESILSGISASTDYINAIPNILSGVGLDEDGNYIPVTAGTRFTSAATSVSGATQALDKALQDIISGAGLSADGKFDKSRFTTDPALSASSSITDAIEDLAQYTEKGFVSGCGLTSAGTLNTSTFTGSSALSGLTSANTLADAISGLGKALDTIAGTGVKSDGTFNNDVFSAGSFVSSATSLADATNKLDEALDTIAGTGLKADGTFDNSVFSSTSFISSASSLADMGQKLDNALQTIAGTGLKADGSFDNSVFSASPILSASSSITDAISDLDSAFEFCCDTAMDAIGNIDEDGNWVIPSAITENFPSGKTSGISSVSDALALLADGGIMFDDFYNDPATDPSGRTYNVRFTVVDDAGKPKLAADVDYCDCGDYD